MTISTSIEHHPENGHCPHVVVLSFEDAHGSGKMWFAFPDRATAERKEPTIRSEWEKALDAGVMAV